MRPHVEPDLPPAFLTITVDRDTAAETVRIAVRGEVDAATSDDMQAAVVGELRQHRPSRVDLDLAGVTFMDSTGIRALVLSQADAEQIGCELRLLNTTPPVYGVLKLVGLLDAFGLAPPESPSEPAGATDSARAAQP